LLIPPNHYIFFVLLPDALRHLHSFPTRRSSDLPVIIQASRGARSYAGDIMLSKMIDALEEMYPQIPLCLHQDHGNDEATCATARSEEHTSELQSRSDLVCRLLLEKKKKISVGVA